MLAPEVYGAQLTNMGPFRCLYLLLLVSPS
jgi:hypothetical protein